MTIIGPITGGERAGQHEGRVHAGAKEYCRQERNYCHNKHVVLWIRLIVIRIRIRPTKIEIIPISTELNALKN